MSINDISWCLDYNFIELYNLTFNNNLDTTSSSDYDIVSNKLDFIMNEDDYYDTFEDTFDNTFDDTFDNTYTNNSSYYDIGSEIEYILSDFNTDYIPSTVTETKPPADIQLKETETKLDHKPDKKKSNPSTNTARPKPIAKKSKKKLIATKDPLVFDNLNLIQLSDLSTNTFQLKSDDIEYYKTKFSVQHISNMLQNKKKKEFRCSIINCYLKIYKEEVCKYHYCAKNNLLCNVPYCKNLVKKNNLCYKHAKALCSFKKCKRAALTNKHLCAKHHCEEKIRIEALYNDNNPDCIKICAKEPQTA